MNTLNVLVIIILISNMDEYGQNTLDMKM
jgi:hypothetical protein